MSEITCGLVRANKVGSEPFVEVVLPTLPRVGDAIWACENETVPYRFVVQHVEFNATKKGEVGKVFLLVESFNRDGTQRFEVKPFAKRKAS